MTKKYHDFSQRLIHSMQDRGYVSLRTPSGICIKTLSKFSGASEQICRRYIRGDALPDYDKIIKIAKELSIYPGWLLFGNPIAQKQNTHDDEVLHFLLMKSYLLYQHKLDAEDYANFVLKLRKEIADISGSKENLCKIIELAVSSISYIENQRKHVI